MRRVCIFDGLIGTQLERTDGGYTFPGVNLYIGGIFQLDIFKIIKGMYKNDTHKLSAMSAMLLPKEYMKRELEASLITPTWATNPLYVFDFADLLSY